MAVTQVWVLEGSVYEDEGATAWDNYDGDVTGAIVVTGLPVDTSAVGDHYIQYLAVDSSGNFAQAIRTVHVVAAVAVTTASWPYYPSRGVPYQCQLAATGGRPGYAWSVVGGELPPGLNLSASGLISGTPTLGGTYNFTVQAEDLNGWTAQKSLTIMVMGTPLEPIPGMVTLIYGVALMTGGLGSSLPESDSVSDVEIEAEAFTVEGEG